MPARLVLLTAGILLSQTSLAYIGGQRVWQPSLLGCVDCFNFTAPSVLGAENVNPAEIGLIVYDTSYESFRAYTHNGRWTKLSNDKVVVGVSSAGSIPVTWDTVLADTSSATFTLTLPTASSVPGREFIIKKTSGSNTLTIDGYSSETIDGQLSINLVSKDAYVALISDGSNFRISNIRDPWRVDANISGANISLGTSGSVTSYAGLENGSLTLTNNTGNGVVSSQVPCSSTNSPSGTTCSTGNESIGVSFTLPRVSDVLACASFSHYVDFNNTGSSVFATFEVVETPNNAQTISQEGKSRVFSSFVQASTDPRAAFPFRVCGTFNFTSAGQKTLRLFYEHEANGGVDNNYIIGDAASAYGQRDIHWEVYPL